MSSLFISMNNLLVGQLNKLDNGALTFSYHDTWLASPYARSLSLSLPLSRKTYSGDVLYNFLDNLLPDNNQIRVKMQKRFRTSTMTPFDLLSAVGRDCIGAIQLTSESETTSPALKYKVLTDKDVIQIINGYQANPLGMMTDEDDFRISLAGAQEKTALLWHNEQWCLPLGSTPTSHIIKLPIGVLSHNNLDLSLSCENEWLSLEIAAAFGLPVANSELWHFEDKTVLAVERFDRKWTSDGRLLRLPQEDMCQALGIAPALKYEADGGPSIKDIMHLLQGSQNAIEDRANFFKTQILFWLLAAPDGHGKNFGLFIEAGNAYRMTPLYDILSAYPFMAANGRLRKQKLKMAMALDSKQRHYQWEKILPRHFISTAKKVGYSEKLAQAHLDDMIAMIPSVISTVETKLPQQFPDSISNLIFEGLLRLHSAH